uniref:hypothetical protein n=1 Tax=Helicobacter suis TaxID=104628 RepID=UPI0013CFEDC7
MWCDKLIREDRKLQIYLKKGKDGLLQRYPVGKGWWHSRIAAKIRRQQNEAVSAVRNIWQDYANSIGKDINKAIQEAFTGLMKKKQDYTTWLYDFKGESDKKFQYIMDLANSEKARILKNMNYTAEVNMDN